MNTKKSDLLIVAAVIGAPLLFCFYCDRKNNVEEKSYEAKIGGEIYDKPFEESTIPEKILRLDAETERQLPRYKSLLTRLTDIFPGTNESQIVNMTAPIWQKCRDLKKDISYYDILTAMSHSELDNHGNACKGYADALTDWTLQYLHLE